MDIQPVVMFANFKVRIKQFVKLCDIYWLIID